MINFEGFSLSQNLKNSLVRMNFIAPTPIQISSIPIALEGKDILGSAQTGTGKSPAVFARRQEGAGGASPAGWAGGSVGG